MACNLDCALTETALHQYYKPCQSDSHLTVPRFSDTTSPQRIRDVLGDLLSVFYRAACYGHGYWRNYGVNLSNEEYYEFLWRWMLMMEFKHQSLSDDLVRRYMEKGFLPTCKAVEAQ